MVIRGMAAHIAEQNVVAISGHGYSDASVDEFRLHKILGEDLQPVVEALLKDLGEEEAVIAVDAVGDGVDAEHGPGDLRNDGVFDSVEVGALVVGGAVYGDRRCWSRIW